MRAWSRACLERGETIVLVPTMGALHEGHLALVERGRKTAQRVIVSVFVNPTQFGPGEDFEAYPRTLEHDTEVLSRQGMTDVVFAPSVDQIYPNVQNLTWVTVDRMGDLLCGASRPGHFKGVTTVVSRLFNITRPDYAVFGMKDAQQFFILRRMTQELGLGTELVGVETVREDDGLALSSRNRYLNVAQREQAPRLFQALQSAREQVLAGERDGGKLIEEMESNLSGATEGRIDYLEIVDTTELQPVSQLESGAEIVVAGAAYFGSARLIDNVVIRVP